MDHECDGSGAHLRVAFTIPVEAFTHDPSAVLVWGVRRTEDRRLYYHEQSYCCAEGIPAVGELLPAEAEITEVSISCGGMTTTVAGGRVTMTVALEEAI